MKLSKWFNIRGWVTLVLTLTFVFLATSGVLLYVAPSCRVAEEMGWTVLWLSKAQWSAIHIVTAFVFLAASLVHLLVYNWKPLMHYVKRKTAPAWRVSRELAVALAVVALLITGAALFWQPFRTVTEFRDTAKAYWSEQRDAPVERGEGRGLGGQERQESQAEEAQPQDGGLRSQTQARGSGQSIDLPREGARRMGAQPSPTEGRRQAR